MKVKICGITNIEDALFAANNGVWAIGFNCYKKSPRYISLKQAREIALQLPKHIIKIAILIDYSKDEILDGLKFLDFIQIYQHDPLLSANKKHMILALQASSKSELPEDCILQEYGFILLDAAKAEDGLLGGTGRTANWNLAKTLAKDYNLILAGGINSENCEEAIKYVQPFALDVASGVELYPRYKNHKKIQEFLMRCKNAK
jgi:phosphoribosylanthranilate isomerase